MIITLQTLIFFREALLTALDRLLQPYYKRFLNFNRHGSVSDDDESEDQVFAEFDDERGVVFYPPMYVQRYAAVSDCLMDERWCGKLEKVVEFGFHDVNFIKYLKEVPGVQCILGVDIENMPMRCASDLLRGDEYTPKRENPLQLTLFQGNAADPDYRLIGSDAVVAIEMIEHMLPHDLDRLVHTIFGFIKPWIVVLTTPNSDFNVLFRALERNGLRRLDHFFEWTREQFHDWCSNIVARYPQYTVNTQGIGPGPPGTIHHGCCSQLALFISRDYHKQQDLNLNSLAIVAKNAENSNNFSDIVGNLIETDPLTESNMICAPNELNCTTLQVKKFSKTTQNLMAKNKLDTLVHTREVIDEIRHLTRMLNFKKEAIGGTNDGIWCNINWGDNAPYWNQYYKIIREYCYPFETKTEESRILDLISDEVNKLVDLQCDEELSVDVNKIEIPLEHLMRAVEHITDDVNRVKDLLEWNGYEVVDDVVIHSRLLMDNVSDITQDDWQDDTATDFDTTEVHSTTSSDASRTYVPAFNERRLRRALDVKVRHLRSMSSGDEDISIELDKVVCRLMKLALKTWRGRQSPPPATWLQCKLFDLLSLTEKAIERRKKHFIDNFLVKALDYDYQKQKFEDIIAKANSKHDDNVNKLFNKYRHLVQSHENKQEKRNLDNYDVDGFDLYDEMSNTSNEFAKVNTEFDDRCDYNTLFDKEETKIQRVQAWVDDDVEVVAYPNHDVGIVNSGDTDTSFSNIARYRFKKSTRKRKSNVDKPDKNVKYHKINKIKYDSKSTSSKSKILKKMSKKKQNRNILISTVAKTADDCENYNRKKKIKEHQKLQSKVSKPIPETFLQVCGAERAEERTKLEGIQCSFEDRKYIALTHTNPNLVNETETNIAATEESLLIGIVVDGAEETIAMRRTIGTDFDNDIEACEQEHILDSWTNIMRDDSFCNKYEIAHDNALSQTIFLNDINEPSTSKGIRHNIATDVQCGPDIINTHVMLSATTSFTKIPKIFNKGLKVANSSTNTRTHISADFGTCTDVIYDNYKTISPRIRSPGIKINDSDTAICEKVECYTMTMVRSQDNIEDITDNIAFKETQLIKPVSSGLRMEDSCSECYESMESYRKSPSQFASSSKNTSDLRIIRSVSKEVRVDRKFSPSKYVHPKLCCGGVHVHSYKGRQECEDVIYQGEWQKYKSKAITRKRFIYNTSTIKKAYETPKRKVNSKEKIEEKKSVRYDEKFEQRKQIKIPSRVPISRQIKAKEVPVNNKKPVPNNFVKTVRYNRYAIKKVASKPKMPLSSITCKIKSIEPVCTPKRYVTPMVPKKIPVVPRKVPVVPKKPVVVPKKDDLCNRVNKSFIPMYIKRALVKSAYNKRVLNQNVAPIKTVIKVNKEKIIEPRSPISKSETNDIRKELLKIQNEPRENISYVVFRNETNHNKNTDRDSSMNTKENTGKRNLSPQSQTSSTCSSPNSIATVRTVSPRQKLSVRKYMTTPNKSSVEKISHGNKKFTKKSKSNNRIENKNLDNKENIPETSSKLNIMNKNSERMAMESIVGATTSIFRAQMNTQTGPLQNAVNSLSRHTSQTPIKSNIKIYPDEKSPTLSRIQKEQILPEAIKLGSDESCSVDDHEVVNISPILRCEPSAEIKRESQCSLPNDSKHLNVISEIKSIIEETLEFIDFISEASLDSGIIMLSSDTLHQQDSLDETFSPVSLRTVIANEDLQSNMMKDNIEKAMNDTYDSMLDSTVDHGDLDMLSCKSTPTETSKISEYFLADTELDDDQAIVPIESSVRDIFERKDQFLAQSTAGPLASQAFSGFSVNAEPVAGDKPDKVIFLDSKTGSVTLDVTRQVTSEELFTSGRSSGTFESCFEDNDAIVPYWLFHPSEQSIDEEEEPDLPSIPPIIVPDALFDDNGNVVTDVGAGAGAGDGHGMHSDNSSDSSGRGTSTSSSDATSGVESEAILIDSSNTAVQYDLVRGTVENSNGLALLQSEIPATEHIVMEGDHNLDTGTSRNGHSGPIPFATSDMDADVSSIDTAPDSSDN